MIKVTPGFDVRFRDVTLVFFNRQDEMYFEHFINMQTIETICCEFAQWFGDFDMPAGNIDTHS